jgi:hypothetical protein
MKKIGHFPLPSGLHKNPTVIQNLFDFLPDICFDAKPQSGGALVDSLRMLTPKRDNSKLTAQKYQTHQNSVGLA